MVRHTEAADDESPAESPPTFADLIDTVDDLSEGEHIRVVYAHKSRYTLDEPDKTTTIDGYVTVADTTYEESHGRTRDRFRLEFRTNRPDSEYTGTLYRVKSGGVNKTASNPCFVSKATGPRHFDQLGRVDVVEAVDEDDDPDAATDGGTDVDAHDLSEGDRVEVEATPIKSDESGRVAGEVVDATVHTMEMGDREDEVGKTVKVRADTGNLYVRKGTGTLSVVDDDGFHVTIAWDSTLRGLCGKCGDYVDPSISDLTPGVCRTCRNEMSQDHVDDDRFDPNYDLPHTPVGDDDIRTDGGDDIIVAGDEGVILTDDDDTDDVHPDDEGVEILTDGGEVPACEACDHDTEPEPSNRGDRVCTWCGAYTDENGNLPRADDKRCPNCDGPVAYGVLKDPREGIRGHLCVGSCDERRIVRPVDEPPVATDGGADVTVAVYHDGTEHVVDMERFEAGFVALLIASSNNTIDSPDVDDDRVDDVYNAFMSPATAPEDAVDDIMITDPKN